MCVRAVQVCSWPGPCVSPSSPVAGHQPLGAGPACPSICPSVPVSVWVRILRAFPAHRAHRALSEPTELPCLAAASSALGRPSMEPDSGLRGFWESVLLLPEQGPSRQSAASSLPPSSRQCQKRLGYDLETCRREWPLGCQPLPVPDSDLGHQPKDGCGILRRQSCLPSWPWLLMPRPGAQSC